MCKAFFIQDGTSVLCGVADNGAYRIDMATQTPTKFGQHDAAVKEICWIPDMNLCVTGSWDKSLRYWDLRSPNAVATVSLPERVACMDVLSPMLVVGVHDLSVLIFDLKNPQTVFKTIASKLKRQTRCISVFPDKMGFAIGSIEGRVSIQHIEDKSALEFVFINWI